MIWIVKDNGERIQYEHQPSISNVTI